MQSSSARTLTSWDGVQLRALRMLEPDFKLGCINGACGRAALAYVEAAVQLCLRSEEHTSELQSQSNLVCRLLLEKKKEQYQPPPIRTGCDGFLKIRGMSRAATPHVSQRPAAELRGHARPHRHPQSFRAHLTRLAP